jgi:hypothetical protein
MEMITTDTLGAMSWHGCGMLGWCDNLAGGAAFLGMGSRVMV